MIAKQRTKREQTHPVCLYPLEKYEKVNTQNDYETTSKQTCFVGFAKVFKFEKNRFKIVQKNF